jgi:hypothetical protein
MVGLDVLPQAVPRLEDLATGLALHAGVHVLGRVATHSSQSIKFNISKRGKCSGSGSALI